ncbi:triose-phosphate isomerase [Motiliproteus sp. SC1-56]|uniref:triose-phosphate isomerase n=1 Tax=Motiliproteus sp. SC1-56 TaxID=2799565 RepID=UPI001A8FA525|nr:triose-phosphate isomerase [Motiliproteus sp. SC1-56]
MRRPLVAGNWKMNGSRESIQALVAGLEQALSDVEAQVVVCPPAVYLDQVAAGLKSSRIALGAQTLSEYDAGAYTGEVSASMLGDFGCRYVLVGHSERRALFSESDAQVAAKFAAAKAAGLVPVLCVGESLDEREAGQTLAVIGAQVGAVQEVLGVDAFVNAVIAYEPVWAIGTGMTATPEQAQQVHAAIRAQVAEKNTAAAEQLPLLYGGSVNAANASALFAMADIDGGLVGGASLKVDEFTAICRAAQG